MDKDRVTIKGDHATLKAPTTAPTNLCSSSGDRIGICVVGRPQLPLPTGDEPPVILRQAVSDRITGFKIKGYKAEGILGFGTSKLRIDHNTLSGNGEYGAFSIMSTRTRMDHNLVTKNKGEAGLYVGDSPNAKATVTRNRVIDNHGLGVFIRDASHGKITRNRIRGNCVGILVLADAPGPAGHWKISRNAVRKNNAACAANPEEGSDAASGLGILLAGANDTTVSRNRVTGNVKKHDTFASGGIVIRRADDDKGTKPSNVKVIRNVLFGNQPFDIDWRHGGTVTFSHNTCGDSKPAGLCS
jgi:nitrous oxidase accessory protein NosD